MLGDLRIVEIGEGMAVQVAGLMLAELGADVLKIERPGGDPSRGTAINQVKDAEFALVSGGPASLPVSSLILRSA